MEKVARKLSFEAGNLARLADGASTCTLGNTSVLVTAVSKPPQQRGTGQNFVPLSVSYRQKAAAYGRIPMTHLRRDVGVTESETLIARMIDRSIRVGFPKGFNHDTQIICNLLAVDGMNDPDVLAINSASASLAISDIPWNGPIGAVRVGLLGEKCVFNPTRKELANSRLDLVISANSHGNVLMMDASCKEPILIADVIKSIKGGIKECKSVIEAINKLRMKYGQEKRTLDSTDRPTKDLLQFVRAGIYDDMKALLSTHTHDKLSRDKAMFQIMDDFKSKVTEKYLDATNSTLDEAFNYAVGSIYREIIAKTKIRCDGRQITDLRPITCQVDLYEPLHGSAMFQRGQTQVLCSTTFDSPDAAFRTNSVTSLLSGVKDKNFMLHYEFPKFATHDIGRVATLPDRREIGHGALAEKAVRPVVPENHNMTIRLNCEVLESNGSSSMASVCAGSMSLMDAGVKISEHVAGVAMGLLSNKHEDDYEDESPFANESKYSILTDILGIEDHIGDMDFKIAGTKNKITAFQLDVKPKLGIPSHVLYIALQRAKKAKAEIIDKMEKVIHSAREERKEKHPVIKTIFIPQQKIAQFIGFGGSNLKKLMATTGVRISAYTTPDLMESGSAEAQNNYMLFAPNQDAMLEAEEYIKSVLDKQKEPELEFNGIYTATIQEILSIGVKVTLYSGMLPALVPTSQLDIRRVSHPSALDLDVGQEIQVKYFGRDPTTGQMRLSRKSLMMSSVGRIQKTPGS